MKYPWDEVMIGIRRNIWLRRRRLNMFGLKKSDNILDAGCGDGLDIQILRSQGYTHITGADLSPTLLKAAKKRNPDVRCLHASADSLPFRDGEFDVVLADSMVYHIAGNTGVIEEIRRVLSAGGRLCFIDMHASWARKLFNTVTFSFLNRFIPYLQKRKNAYLAEQQAIERWQRAEPDFLRMLERAGFRKISVRHDLLSVIGIYQKE